MPPFIPILLLFGGGLYLLSRGDKDKGPAANVTSFTQDGYRVQITAGVREWPISISRDGEVVHTAKNTKGMGPAIDQAKRWIHSRMLPAPTPDTVVEPKPPAGGDHPMPPPPVGEPPVAPVGDASETPASIPLDQIEGRIVRHGLEFRGLTLSVRDLPRFVADVYRSFDPWVDEPEDMLRKMLALAMPELRFDEVRDVIRMEDRDGGREKLSSIIAILGDLQEQVLSPDFEDRHIPYVPDLMAEAMFDEEQRLSSKRFAYRGRIITARPVGSKYRWIITDGDGSHGPSDETFATPEESNEDAIAAIDAEDAVAEA